MIYVTMTPAGLYGSSLEAETDDEAIAKAEGPGWRYEVLDVIEWEKGSRLLVVADD